MSLRAKSVVWGAIGTSFAVAACVGALIDEPLLLFPSSILSIAGMTVALHYTRQQIDSDPSD